MVRHKFGSTGVDVPAIGMGTWDLQGDKSYEKMSIESLQLGLDLGLSHIDTAEMYGSGRVEELVGIAINGRRDSVFLVSKVLPSNATFNGTIKSCKQSLERLKTKWIDLYLLHWPSSVPIKETMHAMEKLVSDGLIRFIGVSNFTVEQLKLAQQSLNDNKIACNQVMYNLESRGIEKKILPYCADQEIAVVGYSPFGHGKFFTRDSHKGRVLVDIASRNGRTPRQVALAFLTRNESLFAIPKASKPEHVKENAGGTGWNLNESDIEEMDKAFPIPKSDRLEMI